MRGVVEEREKVLTNVGREGKVGETKNSRLPPGTPDFYREKSQKNPCNYARYIARI